MLKYLCPRLIDFETPMTSLKITSFGETSHLMIRYTSGMNCNVSDWIADSKKPKCFFFKWPVQVISIYWRPWNKILPLPTTLATWLLFTVKTNASLIATWTVLKKKRIKDVVTSEKHPEPFNWTKNPSKKITVCPLCSLTGTGIGAWPFLGEIWLP